MTECKGMNCGATTGPHSRECLAEHAAAIAGGRFVKGSAPQPSSVGYAFHNPDTGMEWSETHPRESGEVPDAGRCQRMTLAKFREKYGYGDHDTTRNPLPQSVGGEVECAICNDLGDQCMECEEAEFVVWADRHFASADYRKTAAGVYIQDWMRHAFAAWQARGAARTQQIAELKQAFEESQNEVVSRGKLLAAAQARIQQLEGLVKEAITLASTNGLHISAAYFRQQLAQQVNKP